jgi:hypothetical protein
MEEAVISELVSARLFPVTRENTGKFAIFGFEIAKAPRAFGAKFNRLATEFPSHPSRENLRAIREAEAGNSEPYPNNWTCCLATHTRLTHAGSNPGHATGVICTLILRSSRWG